MVEKAHRLGNKLRKRLIIRSKTSVFKKNTENYAKCRDIQTEAINVIEQDSDGVRQRRKLKQHLAKRRNEGHVAQLRYYKLMR